MFHHVDRGGSESVREQNSVRDVSLATRPRGSEFQDRCSQVQQVLIARS